MIFTATLFFSSLLLAVPFKSSFVILLSWGMGFQSTFLKSDTQLPDKDRIVKSSEKDSFFDALDVGFVWLERNLK